MTPTVAAALALLVAFAAARLVSPADLAGRLDRGEHWLRRVGPWVAALVTIGVVWRIWGEIEPIPIYHDEASYLLQAEIFAQGRWTLPTPALPEFFEQPHVLSVPAVASKYPPGHALLLAIGAFVGWVALVPLLLAAATAALLFALVARMTNAWVALLAWTIWLTTPLMLRFQPGYFSQATTTTLVLWSWWALLEWRDSRRRRWLLLLALAIAWGGITRPLSMLAFAIPVGIVVIRDIVPRRAWRDLLTAFAIGLTVFAIVPVWSKNTTGSWTETPIGLYRRQYLPFDKLGFTVDTTRPERALTPVVKELYDDFREQRERQTFERLPRTGWRRLEALSVDLWWGTEYVLLPFAVLGLFFIAAPVWVAVAGALTLFLAHLPYAHDTSWTLYYLEAVPVVAMLSAVGLWGSGAWVAALGRRTASSAVPAKRRAVVLAVLVNVILVAQAPAGFAFWRHRHAGTASFIRPFTSAMRSLPSQPAIVFVRFSASRAHFVNVVVNDADLARAPVWLVHDLGPRNAELLRLVPERTAYLFDEAAMQLRRYP